MSELTPEQTIEQLQHLIKRFEDGTFQGILVYLNYNEKVGWMQSVRGDAQDRLSLVDAAMMSMRDEPNQETRDWFFSQLYERLKRLIPRQQHETGLI